MFLLNYSSFLILFKKNKLVLEDSVKHQKLHLIGGQANETEISLLEQDYISIKTLHSLILERELEEEIGLVPSYRYYDKNYTTINGCVWQQFFYISNYEMTDADILLSQIDIKLFHLKELKRKRITKALEGFIFCLLQKKGRLC